MQGHSLELYLNFPTQSDKSFFTRQKLPSSDNAKKLKGYYPNTPENLLK